LSPLDVAPDGLGAPSTLFRCDCSRRQALRYSIERFPFHVTERFIRSQTWSLYRAYEATRARTARGGDRPDIFRRPGAASRPDSPRLGLAIRPRMAPLMRFFVPSAPSATRVLFSLDRPRSHQRPRACLTHDISTFSVSHALGGFLLAQRRRFVSSDKHSWDSHPSEPSPLAQPQRLSASVALMSFTLHKVRRPPTGLCSARESVGDRRCFHRAGYLDALLGFLPYRVFCLLVVMPASRHLLSRGHRPTTAQGSVNVHG
jgi:hypothetical protein